jgi:pimeloyl-ACP methyl ester carboxylesterase
MSPISFHTRSKALVKGIKIYYETFGNPADPAILLIMGMAASCRQWFPFLYEPLVEGGYYVIRFDNRDFGNSDWLAPDDWEANPYNLADLASDAVGLLDALQISSAHVVGGSMGGTIAQRMAIDYPSYVKTLTCLCSFADSAEVKFDVTGVEQFAGGKPPIELQLQFWQYLAGEESPLDVSLYGEVYRTAYELEGGFHPEAIVRHMTAIHRSGSLMAELSQITVPTLVVHGNRDPAISEAHAAIYAQKIPKATYLALNGVGHEIPARVSAAVHAAMFELFARA